MTGIKARAADFAMAVLAIVVGILLLIGTASMEVRGNQVPGPQFFPILVSGLLLVVGALLLVQQLIGLRRERSSNWHNPDIAKDMLRDFGTNTEIIQLDAIQADEAGGARAAEGAKTAVADARAGINWRIIGLIVLAFVVFILVLEPLGWILSAAALFWVVARCFGSKRTLFDIGVGLLVSSTLQLIFVAGLGLTLPSGFLGVLF